MTDRSSMWGFALRYPSSIWRMRSPSPPPNRFQYDTEAASGGALSRPAPTEEQPVVVKAPSKVALSRSRRVNADGGKSGPFISPS
ncbi:hypothetical protein [Kibdelosporangium aridum]|uniref:hypothetical protein n=1 Tax=Kibdelosporangium aridum TaxID=2030 RepID=UPI0035EA4536